jgi:hypothetical protein
MQKPSLPALTLMAAEHDANLALAVSTLSQSVVEIGKELAIMRDDELWRYVRDPKAEGAFLTWRDYARYRLGTMSTSKMYDYLSAASLIHGEKPMEAVEVERLGVKKSAQIARLPEKKRTKKLLKQIEDASVSSTKAIVEAILASDVAGEEPKARLVPFNIALPQEVIDLIEQVEHDGQFLETVRDNDRTWTLRAKLWHQVWWYFLDEHQEDLKAAAFYRATMIDKKHEEASIQ